MIKVGLTTWTDHPLLSHGKKKATLSEYTGSFPVVEIDSAFYSIPKPEWVQKWVQETPADFQFVVKANYMMTKTPMPRFGEVTDEMRLARFTELKTALEPMRVAGKLLTVLFQFPPSFRCTQANIQYLRTVREQLGDWPLAVEFRNRSWLDGEELSRDTAAFLQSLQMSEVVVDEPHATANGIPFTPVVTNQRLAFMRLHGKNATEWAKGTRERYRYHYSDAELLTLAKTAQTLAQQADTVVVIFNNNTGHDAAPNALTLQRMLHQQGTELPAEQLDLF
ncbi:DUF72 domain-containing protein [Fructilactobacillus carniphilus]|uniref:DUF72 domain-containing protein n=1 Tax=Fructilactobacillus carniphilus TaxID=2940297 RepID=A0ABY5BYH9_9LACO|nr:DUF72 domain-containing protein [Fructilactobacillus carniphilus]USS90166.1 DUF72 domain-containing protein [Fructilactobacillus carniphilus]